LAIRFGQRFFAVETEKHEAKDSDSQKDKRWALETIGSNARLLHNRLFPGRSAAAT
jgi:hypothetical protein